MKPKTIRTLSIKALRKNNANLDIPSIAITLDDLKVIKPIKKVSSYKQRPYCAICKVNTAKKDRIICQPCIDMAHYDNQKQNGKK